MNTPIKYFIPICSLFLIFYSFVSWQSDSLSQSIERGKNIYLNYCNTCHQENGKGITYVFPPLAQSDYLMADKKRAIRTVIYGQNEKIVVNDVTYQAEMLPQELDDRQIADVLNYVMNSWGNKGEEVTVKEVAAERK